MMPALSSQRLAEKLHETNSRLCSWLDTMAHPETHSSVKTCAATPQQMAGLLSELMRAGEWLRGLSAADNEPTLERELNNYRQNVERLKELLPLIHRTLLRERARLEHERARVASAAEWAHRSRQTL